MPEKKPKEKEITLHDVVDQQRLMDDIVGEDYDRGKLAAFTMSAVDRSDDHLVSPYYFSQP